MFQQILYTQWKWSRISLLLPVIAAFVLPVWSVQAFGDPDPNRYEISVMLESVGLWGIWYPLLASFAGLMLALASWAADHRGKHAYALSLPLPRWYYALLRYGAGLVLLAAPVLAVGIGALVATAVAHIPPGLDTYPWALTMRFALATFLAYSVFFAIASGTNKTAGYVLAGIGGIIVSGLIMRSMGVDPNPAAFLVERLFGSSGPLEVFTGRWMLIDV